MSNQRAKQIDQLINLTDKPTKYKGFTDLSIDLETLDTTPSAVITQIGLQFFNRDDFDSYYPHGVHAGRRYSIHVGILSQPSRTMSLSTIKWWLRQDKAAKKQFSEGQARSTSLRRALMYAATAVRLNSDPDKVRVWGNGAAFDNAILEHAYKGRQPWRFWNDRCLRTLLDIVGVDLKKEIPFVGTPHVAADDAAHQARIVIRATTLLNEKGENNV